MEPPGLSLMIVCVGLLDVAYVSPAIGRRVCKDWHKHVYPFIHVQVYIYMYQTNNLLFLSPRAMWCGSQPGVFDDLAWIRGQLILVAWQVRTVNLSWHSDEYLRHTSQFGISTKSAHKPFVASSVPRHGSDSKPVGNRRAELSWLCPLVAGHASARTTV